MQNSRTWLPAAFILFIISAYIITALRTPLIGKTELWDWIHAQTLFFTPVLWHALRANYMCTGPTQEVNYATEPAKMPTSGIYIINYYHHYIYRLDGDINPTGRQYRNMHDIVYITYRQHKIYVSGRNVQDSWHAGELEGAGVGIGGHVNCEKFMWPQDARSLKDIVWNPECWVWSMWLNNLTCLVCYDYEIFWL